MNRLPIIFLMAWFTFLILPALASAQKKEDIDSDFNRDVNLDACVLPDLKLSPQTQIYAVGARGGSKLNWQIDDSGRGATLIKVAVNSPKEPVVLILGAHEPTIWHLGWTKGSQIAAVAISGHSTQKITGLPKSVPVLISTKENGAACGEFYIESSKKTIPPKASAVSNRLFGRGIDNMYAVINGQAVVGEILPAEAKLITNAELRREDFHPSNKPLFGEAGITEAIDKGLIRKATSDDIQEYFRLLAKADGLPKQITPESFTDNIGLSGAYVVLSPAFMAPPGLSRDSKFLVLSEAAEPLETTGSGKFYRVSRETSPKKEPTSYDCGFTDLSLPAGFQVYAASVHDSGVPLDLKLDNKNNEIKLIKVVVNSPEKPVVLMLGTYMPTVWHFSWTKGSKIVALAVSGGYPPIVMGLPEDVPILKISNNYLRDSPHYKKCPRIDVHPVINSLTAANDFSKYLFEKDIDQIVKIENGEVLFGRPLNDQAKLETGEEFSSDKFNAPDKPLTYKLAFDEAKKKGLIRVSGKEDIQAYLKALSQVAGLPDGIVDEGLSLSDEAPADHSMMGDFSLLNSYTILSPDYIIPENLYPSNVKISFILPRGMKKPEREPDNAIIYDVNEPLLPETKESARSETAKPCTLPKVQLPPNTKIYAGSGFLSSPVDFDFAQEPNKRQRAELVPLTINSPNAPVALILQGRYYHPAVWHFSWTKDTKIAAVITRDHVVGLPEDVPVLNPKGCRGFDFPIAISNIGDVTALAGLNDFSREIFNKDIDRLYFEENNVSLIGEPLAADVKLISARELKLNELIDPDEPWGDQTALTEDILKGYIRKATTQDMRERLRNMAREAGLPEHIINSLNLYNRTRPTHYLFNRNEPNPIPNTYMVLSPDFNIPATLYHRKFKPITGTIHGDKESESGVFYYPDGSVISCSFSPGEAKHSSGGALKTESSQAVSKSNNATRVELPPNFRLIYKSAPLADAYELLTPDSIHPANERSKLFVSYLLPDGGRTFCSYTKEVDYWGPVDARPQQLFNACAFNDFQIPPRLKVYAAGVRSGSKLNFTMGNRGNTAELVKVIVNSPEEPVALLLGGSAPTIWHLSWTEGTSIAAVIVSSRVGIDPQRLIGLPKDVPVIYAGNACPFFDVNLSSSGYGDIATIGAARNVNNLAKHLFNKDIDQMYDIFGGQIIIGQAALGGKKVETAEEFEADKFTDPKRPLAGIHGINQAISKGLIRKATEDDYKKWLVRHYTQMQNIPEDKVEEAIADDSQGNKYDRPPNPYSRAYVVLSPDFVVPAGLNSYGSDSADFIIPENIPVPSRQHASNSTFYMQKDGSCAGNDARPVCKANPR